MDVPIKYFDRGFRFEFDGDNFVFWYKKAVRTFIDWIIELNKNKSEILNCLQLFLFKIPYHDFELLVGFIVKSIENPT